MAKHTDKAQAEFESYQFFNQFVRPLATDAQGHFIINSSTAHNNDVDAFRHAYVSGVFTLEYGSLVAKVLGDANEIKGNLQGQDPKEENMDSWNNYMGREHAAHVKTKEELAAALAASLLEGKLIIDINDPRDFEKDLPPPAPQEDEEKEQAPVSEQPDESSSLFFSSAHAAEPSHINNALAPAAAQPLPLHTPEQIAEHQTHLWELVCSLPFIGAEEKENLYFSYLTKEEALGDFLTDNQILGYGIVCAREVIAQQDGLTDQDRTALTTEIDQLASSENLLENLQGLSTHIEERLDHNAQVQHEQELEDWEETCHQIDDDNAEKLDAWEESCRVIDQENEDAKERFEQALEDYQEHMQAYEEQVERCEAANTALFEEAQTLYEEAQRLEAEQDAKEEEYQQELAAWGQEYADIQAQNDQLMDDWREACAEVDQDNQHEMEPITPEDPPEKDTPPSSPSPSPRRPTSSEEDSSIGF